MLSGNARTLIGGDLHTLPVFVRGPRAMLELYGRARSLLSLPDSSARSLGIIFRFNQLGRRVSSRPAAAVEQDSSR